VALRLHVDVATGSIRLLPSPFFVLFLAIRGSLLLEPAAQGYETSKLLNGIAAGGGRHHRPVRDLRPML
jgi:hypothetical protein